MLRPALWPQPHLVDAVEDSQQELQAIGQAQPHFVSVHRADLSIIQVVAYAFCLVDEQLKVARGNPIAAAASPNVDFCAQLSHLFIER